jgi:hypothetical protein
MIILNIKLRGLNKMKKLLRDALGRFKSVKINLLDGQKRGEIIFRRAFFILVMFTIVALLGMLLIEKEPYEEYIKEVQEVDAREEGIDGVGNIVKEGDIINGQEVVVEDGQARYIYEYEPLSDQVKAVKTFVFDVYKGRYSEEYFELLVDNCSDEGLRTVVAISVAESSMGKNTNRKTNWYGWFKGGNRNYDPSQEEMAKEICTGVEKNYLGIGTDMNKVKRYVGSVSSSWLGNYIWAYNQMEVK